MKETEKELGEMMKEIEIEILGRDHILKVQKINTK